MRFFSYRKENKMIYTFMGMLILIIAATVMKPSFLTVSNFVTILRQSSILLMLSLGLTGVVLTGNIDLSVGSTAAFAGCICAKLLVGGHGAGISISMGMAAGLVIGLVNGLLAGGLALPSFVATYGVNMVVSGFSLMVMQGGIIYDLPSDFTKLGIGYIGPVPVLVIISAVIYLLLLFLFKKTIFGRSIYMIGYNKRASEYSGINTLKVLVMAYLISGLTGALGGILMTARLNAADAAMGETYGLQIVAAVVVGGTSLLGGEGGVTGTVLGAVILTMIVNIMNMNRIHSNWQNFVLGIVILALTWLNIRGTMKKRQT